MQPSVKNRHHQCVVNVQSVLFLFVCGESVCATLAQENSPVLEKGGHTATRIAKRVERPPKLFFKLVHRRGEGGGIRGQFIAIGRVVFKLR